MKYIIPLFLGVLMIGACSKDNDLPTPSFVLDQVIIKRVTVNAPAKDPNGNTWDFLIGTNPDIYITLHQANAAPYRSETISGTLSYVFSPNIAVVDLDSPIVLSLYDEDDPLDQTFDDLIFYGIFGGVTFSDTPSQIEIEGANGGLMVVDFEYKYK